MEVITSLDNKKVKFLNKLKEKKYRDEEGKYLVETKHLIMEAYNTNLLDEVILLENTDIDLDVRKTYVSSNVLKKISSLSSETNMIGVVKKFNATFYGKRLILLDGIQDPGNLGTIIRSAVAFNMDTIILSEDCVDLYNSKVVRASEGMIFKIDILRRNLTDFINEINKNNYHIFGTDVVNGTILNNVKFPKKFALIIGNEGNGIKEEIKSLVNENIYIPMSNKTESLNASVASSIIMYEMSKVDYE